MTLQPGTKLGPYEIQSAVGAGGMGEVYRARDTRLGRDVAIKVLPESFARDADRLRRFEQEARAVAALNHPNILGVYDIGEHQGSPYMVCELLEGETLREKMQEGAMAQRRAVEYASQIAEGLAAAHDKSVVHRDLKPENVFVTKDGRVKLLDFGLAKLARMEAAAAADGVTAGAATHTTPGMVLGTAGYMSPEQVRGKDVDARTDIFAFGAILYEMLSGRRAFRGESSVETMNAILKEEPPELDTQALKVSPGLERIVRRCLEKEPARRFHSARDVGFALEAISGSSSASAVQPLIAAPEKQRLPWMAIAVVAVLVAGIALAAYMAGRRTAPSVSPTYQQLTFEAGWAGPARFTRDGNTVVYSAAWNGEPIQLYSQRANRAQPQALKVDANVVGIADTGDMAVILKHHYLSSWLQRGTLARLPLEGGTPRPILENVYAADITRDGKEFAAVLSSGPKQRLEYPLGKVLFETTGWITHVRISSDGRHVAFIEHPIIGDDRGNITMADVAGTHTKLTPDYNSCQGLAWTPDEKELWFSASMEGEDNSIYAVNMSGKMRSVVRSPGVTLIEDIAPSGKVLLSSVHFQIDVGVKRGNEIARNFNAGVRANLSALSPDGQWLVFNLSEGDDYKVYLRNTNGSAPILLGDGYGAGITPDARTVPTVLFSKPHTLVLNPTGAGERREIDLGKLRATSSSNENGVTFSRDGRWGLMTAMDDKNEIRDYLLDMKSGSIQPVTPPGSSYGKLSPEGRRVVTYNLATARPVMVEVSSGKTSDIPGIEPDDALLGWTLDGSSVLVWNQELPARVSELNVSSGKRRLLLTVEPFATLGSMYARMAVSADGRTAAYRQRRGLFTLYIADGVK